GAAGIGLFSTDTTTLDGNDCGANEGNGIEVGRDPNSPDAPATHITLHANTCHDNDGAGIFLASTDTTTLNGNDCGANKGHGIAVARDHRRSPDAPATNTTLHANTCHDNGEAGIGLGSSPATLEGNACWGNPTNEPLVGSFFGREVLTPTVHSHAIGCPLSPEAWARQQAAVVKEREARKAHAAVIARVRTAVDPPLPGGEALAQFLGAGWCVGCFTRFWMPEATPPLAPEAPADPPPAEPAAATSQTVQMYDVCLDQAGGLVGFRRRKAAGAAPLLDLLLKYYREIGPGRARRRVYVGIVSPDDAPVDDFLALARALTQPRGAPPPPAWRTEDKDEIAGKIQEYASALRPPLVSIGEGSGALLEEALLRGRGRLGEALRELFTGPGWMLAGVPLVLVVASLALMFFGLPLDIAPPAWGAALVGLFAPLLGKIGGGLLLALCTVAAPWMANVCLPPPLRLHVGDFLNPLFTRFGLRRPGQDDTPKDKNVETGRWARMAWGRWLRHRLFAANDLPLVCFRGIDAWSRPHIDDLRALPALARDDESLMVVVHMGDKTLFTPGFLGPWLDPPIPGTPPAAPSPLAFFDEVHLIVVDTPHAVALRLGEAVPAASPGLAPLLKAADPPSIANLAATLRHPGWAEEKLLALAPLASTPAAPFRLTFPCAKQAARDRRTLLAPYHACFPSGSSAKPQELEPVLQAAERTPAVHRLSLDSGAVAGLVGRVGQRRAVGAQLAALFQGPSAEVERTRALATLLACGEMHHLREARAMVDHLATAPDAPESARDFLPWKVAFHLEAALFLRRDRRALGRGAFHEPPPLTEARAALSTALHTRACPRTDEATTTGLIRAYGAFLSLEAEEPANGGSKAGEAPSVPVWDPLAVSRGTAPPAVPGSAHDRFVTDLVQGVRKLLSLDGGYAGHLLRAKLGYDWHPLPPSWKAALTQVVIDERPASRATLSDLLLTARDDTERWALIANHASAPPVLALGLGAAAALGLNAGPRDDTRLERLTTLALVLARVRDAAPPAPDHAAIPLALSRLTSAPAPPAAALDASAALLALLEDPAAQERLLALVRDARPLAHQEIEGLTLGALGPVNQCLADVREVCFLAPDRLD
ncbi:right-handed parallel beta-helix repeat-containing protein, partial [Pararhodospirillum oryzae]|uniref:right-handed parallel beta-helix repeat-containing protein n=1 Tax=Pararhodospirillum oryzae TaxID=478448 RepID=UPI0011BF784D